MGPFLQIPPRPSTTITSPLMGAVNLAETEISESLKALWLELPRDSHRCTVAFRLAIFTIKLLSAGKIVTKLETSDLDNLLYFLPLVIQLIDDDLSIENCNGITGVNFADQREEYLELVFQGRKLISDWINEKEPLKSLPETTLASYLVSSWEKKLEGLDGVTPTDYRVGQCFVKLMTSVDTLASQKSPEDVAKICREARTANGIRSASWFAVLRSSILSNPVGNRICNELVADSTGLKPEDPSSQGLFFSPQILLSFCTKQI